MQTLVLAFNDRPEHLFRPQRHGHANHPGMQNGSSVISLTGLDGCFKLAICRVHHAERRAA